MTRTIAIAVFLAPWLGACAAPVEPHEAAVLDVGASREAITAGWNDEGDPGVAALMRNGSIACTGTLISPSAIVTAAHCADIFLPEEARFGPDPAHPLQRVRIVEADKHPAYDRETYEHDIAVLTLAYDVDAAPADLPRSPISEERVGSQARIVGYGLLSAGADTDLRKREGFSRIDSVDHGRFRLSGDPSQPCLGDSGGPTFLRVGGREPLVGVHSSGSPSCTGGSDETRVDAHMDFLSRYLATPYAAPQTTGTVSAGCAVTGSRGAGGGLWLAALALVLIGFRVRSVTGRARGMRDANEAASVPRRLQITKEEVSS